MGPPPQTVDKVPIVEAKAFAVGAFCGSYYASCSYNFVCEM